MLGIEPGSGSKCANHCAMPMIVFVFIHCTGFEIWKLKKDGKFVKDHSTQELVDPDLFIGGKLIRFSLDTCIPYYGPYYRLLGSLKIQNWVTKALVSLSISLGYFDANVNE